MGQAELEVEVAGWGKPQATCSVAASLLGGVDMMGRGTVMGRSTSSSGMTPYLTTPKAIVPLKTCM